MAQDKSVCIHGSGVAALTCARLLHGQGWRVGLEPGRAGRPSLHLLLNDATATLLATLWDDPSVLAAAHRINVRRVALGGASAGTSVAAPGVVIGADRLCQSLAARLRLDPAPDADWTIDARPVLDDAAPTHCFGRRRAWMAPVTLYPGVPADLCVLEAVRAGWMFLLPLGGARASLQLVSPWPAASLPGPGQVIGRATALIADAGAWSEPVPAMARITLPPGRAAANGRPGWIAVGEAAAGFDPISGDGVGHALRGAVLACAVLQAIAGGAPAAACLSLYSSMLRQAMAHHLRICLGFYHQMTTQGGWASEVAAMADGDWLVS